MKKILLPTDFSEISQNAIQYSNALLAKNSCKFFLLNVYRVPYLTNEELLENDAQQLSIIESELFDASQKALNDLQKAIAPNKKHQYQCISDYNFFINSVKNYISEKEIDLIILGTKGATGAKEIFLGSNTGDVLMKTDCNVIAVPEGFRFNTLDEIVFPTDYKIKYELKSLEPLIELALQNNSTIRILHLNETGELSADQENNKKILDSYLDQVDHYYHTLSNMDFEEALNCFTQSRANIDMIAILAGHYNFFQRLFFRPKVMELSFHTRIPLFVMHQTS